MTDATSETGTVGSLFFSFLCSALYIIVCPLVHFLLAIVLSVLRFTTSDYSVGIFKPLLTPMVYWHLFCSIHCFLSSILQIIVFSPFSFGHYIVCQSSVYRFYLTIAWQLDFAYVINTYPHKSQTKLNLSLTSLLRHNEIVLYAHKCVVVVIVWQLDLQLPEQSVFITTNFVSSNPVHGEVYSIRHYVIKLVSDLRQVCGFLRELRLPPAIKLIATI